MPRSSVSRSSLAVGAAAVCATAAVALGRARRRTVREVDEEVAEEEELRLVLLAIKSLSKSTYLMVSDAKGERFSERGLASVVRQRGLVVEKEASTRTLAEALASDLDVSKRRGAAAYAPPASGRRLRHALVRGGVDGAVLRAKFPAMRDAYIQQRLDYGRHSRYGDSWRISCYVVVMASAKPRIAPHQPMVDCMGDIMDACVALFEQWYSRHFHRAATASVMNCFVTRYRPRHDEDQLKKHIDGANVDGSVILALPTDDPFDGGDLKVWDGPPTGSDRQPPLFHYADLRPGDAILLDGRLWHQAMPITSGTRYALVLFLKLRRGDPPGVT